VTANPSARFPSTAWTCVQAAQDPSHPDFIAAINRLIAAYWKPVFHYLRAKGQPAAQAEDLTQEFFLCFLDRGWLSPADAQRGRFRNYLCTLLRYFAYSQTVRAKRQKVFERHLVSIHSLIQDSDRAYEPPARETPEEAFEKQWHVGVREAVRQNLRNFYEGLNKPKEWLRFEIFAAYYFVERAEDQPTQEALAARFGVSREQVRYALATVHRRYERFARQELRDQVGSEDDVEEARNLL
jgi:RNA polymerase sigma-70 factor (ECF subfamily)